MKWKLYYGDGSCWSSDDGPWLDAPAWNVQAVVVDLPQHARTIFQGDFYFVPANANDPFAGDQWGVIDMLLEVGGMVEDERFSDLTPDYLIEFGVKFGRTMDYDAYKELWAKIVSDADTTFAVRTPDTENLLDSRHSTQPWIEGR